MVERAGPPHMEPPKERTPSRPVGIQPRDDYAQIQVPKNTPTCSLMALGGFVVRGMGVFKGGHLDGGEIIRGCNGESGLDDVDAELRKLLCHLSDETRAQSRSWSGQRAKQQAVLLSRLRFGAEPEAFLRRSYCSQVTARHL